MNYNYAEKYIKKPVVVEVFHYRKNYTDYKNLAEFCGEALEIIDENINPIIQTVAGYKHLYDDCYVIKSEKGNFYPYKPNEFEQIYEKVEE